MAFVATIGFFDGVHLGHQFVLEQLRDVAQSSSMQAAVITFYEHPQTILSNANLPLLTTFSERIALLRQQAVDQIFAFHFDVIQQMTAEEFMHILHEQCDVRTLLMGYDHHFGSDRLTRFDDYQAIANRLGIKLIALPASNGFAEANTPEHEPHITTLCTPSSTKIRKALAAGLIEEANLMLGYDYPLSGEVVEGRHLGRTIGFPTANIHIPEDKLCPVSGVYAATIDDETLGFIRRPAIVNIGTNPTVGGRKTTVEAHIPNWDGDIYGHHLTVRLKRYLRPEKKFPSMQHLKEQIRKDISLL